MTPEEIAEIIIKAIDQGRSNDIYTHAATQKLASQAIDDRISLEDAHLSLWLAMHESYRKS